MGQTLGVLDGEPTVAVEPNDRPSGSIEQPLGVRVLGDDDDVSDRKGSRTEVLVVGVQLDGAEVAGLAHPVAGELIEGEALAAPWRDHHGLLPAGAGGEPGVEYRVAYV